MGIEVWSSDDAGAVLERAGQLLGAEPVLHNLVLTLLHGRIDRPEPGRYWVAIDGRTPVGVVFQSPLDFAATITPMPERAVDAAVSAIVEQGVELPGVNGDARTAARFAGQWTEANGTAATPDMGLRIYELDDLVPPARVGGGARLATSDDLDVVAEMAAGFHADTGETGTVSVGVWAEFMVALGRVWLWDHDQVRHGPCAMAAHTPSVEGVTRIQAVYTPPDHRRRGYAGALVADLSGRLTADDGSRVMLYTDLGNPTSNSVYRRIGFRAVAENLRYRFAPHTEAGADEATA